jgi:hypothetical protein
VESVGVACLPASPLYRSSEELSRCVNVSWCLKGNGNLNGNDEVEVVPMFFKQFINFNLRENFI